MNESYYTFVDALLVLMNLENIQELKARIDTLSQHNINIEKIVIPQPRIFNIPVEFGDVSELTFIPRSNE